MLILALNSNHLLGKSTPVGKEDKTAKTLSGLKMIFAIK
jgi:hypothetical protein